MTFPVFPTICEAMKQIFPPPLPDDEEGGQKEMEREKSDQSERTNEEGMKKEKEKVKKKEKGEKIKQKEEKK